MMAIELDDSDSFLPRKNVASIPNNPTDCVEGWDNENAAEFASFIVRRSGGNDNGDNERPTIDDDDNDDCTEEGVLAEVPISIRYLALATMFLLVVSNLLLAGQCLHGRSLRESSNEAYVTEWKLLENQTSTRRKLEEDTIEIRKTAKKSGKWVGNLMPGNTYTVVGPWSEVSNKTKYINILSPYLGFVAKPTGEVLRDDPDVSPMCPLIYTSLPRIRDGKPGQYKNAPMPLVIGQSLWNATQIFHLFLLICLVYDATEETGRSQQARIYRLRRVVVLAITTMTILLLPFAAYLIAPGAYIWSFLTLILVVLALSTTNEDKLCLSIGHMSVDHHEDSHGHGNENTTSYRRNILLIREETLCMVCYFGSTVYNKAAGGHYHGFKWFDSTFGLQKHGDVTPKNMYHLMGFASPVNIPPFVSRAYGSTSASRVFAGVWTVLPFLYVFNFVVMLAMSHRSPGKWTQRFLATFGMIHFLFFTDAVSYMYGRGYRNEHEDFFHWTEKWSWRIGIMLPLYQNCTNGHWGRKSHRFSILGVAQRYFAMTWGVLFFVVQTLQSDVIRTYGFLTGGDSSKGLIRLWGLDKKSSLMKKLDYPYFKALVWMWMMYAILHLCCFRLNRVNLRRNSSDRKRLAFKNS